jgi:hypothetical protein
VVKGMTGRGKSKKVREHLLKCPSYNRNVTTSGLLQLLLVVVVAVVVVAVVVAIVLVAIVVVVVVVVVELIVQIMTSIQIIVMEY